MVEWDEAWWDNQVLPPLYAAVERYVAMVTDEQQQAELLAAVALTVTLSIILHGITAAPWARIYSRTVAGTTGLRN